MIRLFGCQPAEYSQITNKSRRQQYNCNAIPRHLISYFVVNETRDDARKSSITGKRCDDVVNRRKGDTSRDFPAAW